MPQTVGARIRRLRLERGLTQEQLGEPLLTESFISMVETGKRQPSLGALEHIAGRLGTDVEHLQTGRPVGAQVELEIALQEARRKADDGDVDAARRVVRRALAETKAGQFPRTRARALELKGWLAERVEGSSRAIRHYQEALELWANEPLHLKAEAMAGLARCTRRLETPQMAVHLLESYRREMEDSGDPDPSALMRTLTALIYPYFAAGLPEKAAAAAREALDLEPKVDDADELACMHMTVARTMSQQGHFGDALASLQRAEEIFLAGGWKSRVAKAQINEAIVLSKKEDFESARDKLTEALDTLKESPNQLDQALALNELGHVARHLGDVEAALDYLDQAQPLLADGDVIERAFNAREHGICLTDQDSHAAEKHLLRAIDLYRIEGTQQEVATTFKALAEVYLIRDDSARAIQALRDGITAIEERST